jgi:hypothetical protein
LCFLELLAPPNALRLGEATDRAGAVHYFL